MARASKSAAYYERGLARLENRWIGRGADGRQYLDETHLYADDLDIFGRGSLFQLLCTAQTPMGQDTLAAWLSAPADLPTIRDRQRLVRDLAASLDLREALASLDADLGRIVPEGLLEWSAAPPLGPTAAARATGAVLAWGLTIAALAAIVFGGWWWPMLIALAIAEAIYYVSRRHTAREISRHVGAAGYALGVLFRLRSVLRDRRDVPAALAVSAAAIDRDLGFPTGWIAETYGLLLQNSFLHALKVQAVPLLESWRLQARAGAAQALAAAGKVEAHRCPGRVRL